MTYKYHVLTDPYFAVENHTCFNARLRDIVKPPQITNWWWKQSSHCLSRSQGVGRQAGCPQEVGMMPPGGGYWAMMGSITPLCNCCFSPFKKSPPVPRSSVPGQSHFPFSLLGLNLSRNNPIWIPICRTAELRFAYVLEKLWTGSYKGDISNLLHFVLIYWNGW